MSVSSQFYSVCYKLPQGALQSVQHLRLQQLYHPEQRKSTGLEWKKLGRNLTCETGLFGPFEICRLKGLAHCDPLVIKLNLHTVHMGRWSHMMHYQYNASHLQCHLCLLITYFLVNFARLIISCILTGNTELYKIENFNNMC